MSTFRAFTLVFFVMLIICAEPALADEDTVESVDLSNKLELRKPADLDYRMSLTTRRYINLNNDDYLAAIIGEPNIEPDRYGYKFDGFFEVIERATASRLRKSLKNFIRQGPEQPTLRSHLEHLRNIEKIDQIVSDYGNLFPRTLEEAMTPRDPTPTKLGHRTTILSAGPVSITNDLRITIDEIDIDLFDQLRKDGETIRREEDLDSRGVGSPYPRDVFSLVVSKKPERRRSRGNVFDSDLLSVDAKLSFKLKLDDDDYVDSVVSSISLKLKAMAYDYNGRPLLGMRAKVRFPRKDEFSITVSLFAMEL